MAEPKAKKKSAAPKTYYIATGRRKSAVARVRLLEGGKGNILINDRPLEDYFTEDKDRAAVLGPLKVTDQLNRLDVIVKATGGGITGQAGAVCQGIARAIKTMFSPSDEQSRHIFNTTTIIKAKHDQAKEREKAKLAPPPPPPPPPRPVIGPNGKIVVDPNAAPAAPAEPVDPAVGMIKKLRDSGYLTRDARMKERKKYGLRGARRGTQFSKR
jgi:small subunit ribosomal protein S9